MNRITNFLLISLSVLFLGACDNKFEDDVFAESASERISNAITEYNTLLASSENGWGFEYYPGGANRTLGGYMFTTVFTETEVTAMLDILGTTMSDTSAYDVIANGGPTLSFDMYNEVFHAFSTPTSQNYNGYLADYEFLLMSHTDDVIILKGKKYGSYMRLVRLTENPTSFLTKVTEMTSHIEGRGLIEFVMGGETIEFSKNGRVLTYNYTKDGTETSESMAYIYTATGMRFYEPVIINGQTVQDLYLDTSDSTLKTEDGTIVFYLALPLTIDLTSVQWSISPGTAECSDLFNQAFTEIQDANTATWGEYLYPLIHFGLTDDDTTGISFFSVASGGAYRSVKGLIFLGTKNQGEVSVALGEDGFNWRWYTHLYPLVNLIVDNAPYTVEKDDEDNPTVVKLTSVSNPDVWFTINQ